VWQPERLAHFAPSSQIACIESGDIPMSVEIWDRTLIVTLVRTAQDKVNAQLMIESLRSFGGSFSLCPIWIFEGDPQLAPCRDLEGTEIRIMELGQIGSYRFAGKVRACAQAEEAAAGRVRTLVWIDPACLIVNPPRLFDLGKSFDAAVRPVHIKNVGLLAGEPLDGFWQKVFELAGVNDVRATVDTFVDGHRIRAYFNSHAFAVNPSRGLLGKWLEQFDILAKDKDYQAQACLNETHRIFLHQAVLSALLATKIEPSRLRLLPPDYNYPYNLHGSVPSIRSASAFNDLVCLTYEDRSLDPKLIDDIEIREPHKSWLSKHYAQ
jgi:hypothetical protein